MRKLTKQSIEDIAIGAAILGTGGGGDPYIGKLMALSAIEEYGPITLLDPEEISDEDLVVPSAMMGAPTVLVEKIPSGEEVFKSFSALESYLGKEVKATMPIEAGGVNSMMPLALAAKLGLPVIDADGMGRAFPELQMVTFSIYDVSATPMVLADEKGNSVLFNTIDNKWTEDLARGATITMGGSTMVAIYPMDGAQVKEGGIKNIVTFTEEIGKALRTAKEQGANPIKSLSEVMNGHVVFTGKIVDINRRTEGGFARGTAILEGIDDFQGNSASLDFQNEHLVCRVNEKVAVSVPDLITVHDAETGYPITTEGMRYGQRILVMGSPCTEKWRSEKGLSLVGPAYFGYEDVEFIPVEDRIKQLKGGN
ncbi:DUF917 domain-containing protein [Natranaerobius thermophilus]|uniref:DUF917 domain-containing protein n=1 Tax=Natranaerobius thermophilus (strain ATCC BAA-1301 / DSM 18059 / JW/NM-WN-LF) TaxID=457570 RepID=B2A883_NATTJ|nr:DUF917 domain-containing protein [Natranaerobius thermophilus]ACB84449.1 protein of unknown function DUF917 [Natranaerobius thermophilus JW/NM-WN-LF]